MKSTRRLVSALLVLLLALPLYTALAMQAGPVSIEGWEDVTVAFGKAAKETAVKVAENPVTGNKALCLSVTFDKENGWCDAAVLRHQLPQDGQHQL